MITKEKIKKFNPFADEVDLTSGNLFTKMLLFTVPILLLALFQLLYSSMDQIVVTNFGDGAKSFDAIASNNSLINLLIGLFVGVSVGANVVVAKAKGEKDAAKAHRAIESAMILSVIFGVVVGLGGYFLSRDFLVWMQTPASYLDEAVTYLQLYFIGMPFLMIFNFGAACLRAMGDSKRPLYALLSCGVLNVLLNFLFVLGFNMKHGGWDVFAVGLTTVFSQALEAFLIVIFLCKKKGFAYLSFKDLKLYPEETKQILIHGIPAGLQSFVFSISNVVIQSSVNGFQEGEITSEIAVAGNAASIQIEGYIWIVMNSFSTAVVAIVAQNLGAGKKENIVKALWMSLLCSTVLGLALGGLSVLLYQPLLGIFLTPGGFKTDSNTLEEANRDYSLAMEVGRQRLLLVGLTYFLDGWMDNTSGFCRGLGHPNTPTIITFLAVTVFRLVFIFTAWTSVPFFHTLPWLWSSWPISWVLAVSAYYCFVPSYIKKAFQEIDLRKGGANVPLSVTK
jgi:putative MATE family efflux protein